MNKIQRYALVHRETKKPYAINLKLIEIVDLINRHGLKVEDYELMEVNYDN